MAWYGGARCLTVRRPDWKTGAAAGAPRAGMAQQAASMGASAGRSLVEWQMEVHALLIAVWLRNTVLTARYIRKYCEHVGTFIRTAGVRKSDRHRLGRLGRARARPWREEMGKHVAGRQRGAACFDFHLLCMESGEQK